MVSDLTLYNRNCKNYYVTKQKHQSSTSINQSSINSLNLSSSQSSPEVSPTRHSSSGTSQSSIQQNSTLTDNTLSMVPTPWSTESWTSQNYYFPFEEQSSTIITSSTTMPGSSTSSGGCTPEMDDSKNTITILKPDKSYSCKSYTTHPLTTNKSVESLDTLSSWTVESFVSPVEYSDSNIIKAIYPWSPCTFLSGSDFYPSTMDTFSSSVVSIVTSTLKSVEDITFPSDSLTMGKYFLKTVEYECSA